MTFIARAGAHHASFGAVSVVELIIAHSVATTELVWPDDCEWAPVSVGSLLRREGRAAHASDRPLKPREHGPRVLPPPQPPRRIVKRATTSAGAVLAAGAVFGGAIMSDSLIDVIKPGDGGTTAPGSPSSGAAAPSRADGVGAAVGLTAVTVEAPTAPGGTARVTGATIVGDVLAQPIVSQALAGVPVLPPAVDVAVPGAGPVATVPVSVPGAENPVDPPALPLPPGVPPLPPPVDGPGVILDPVTPVLEPVGEILEPVEDTAGPLVEDTARPLVEDLVDTATPVIETATDTATPVIETATDTATDTAKPAVETATGAVKSVLGGGR